MPSPVLSLSQTCILPLQFVDTCWNSYEGFSHLVGVCLAAVRVVSYEMTAQCSNLAHLNASICGKGHWKKAIDFRYCQFGRRKLSTGLFALETFLDWRAKLAKHLLT